MKDVKRDKLRFVLLCLLLLCSVDSLTWTGQPANPTEAIKGNNVVLTWNYSLTTAEQTNSQQFFAIEWSKFNLSSLVFDRIAIKTFVALVGVPSYQEPLSPHIVVDRNHKTDSVSLHISDVRRDDEGQYKIEYLEDFAGTVLADLVMNLTVLVSPTVISENQTVTEGEDLSLLCSAKGKPQPRTTLIELSSNSVVSGNFTSISREDAGGYNCTADNGVGSPVSKVVFIDVQYPPEGIQLRVSEEEVCNGKTISFICSAETANPMNLNYQLYENNTMIDVISSTGVWNKTSWTVEGVFFYKCVVNNSVGTAMSLNVSVNVNVSSFIMPISNEVITEGGTLNLSCPATGIPRPTVFWVKTSNGERTDGTELVIRNISRSEAGEYRCEATNPCGNASESATIDVQYPPEGIQLLVSEEEVCNGTTISFNCSAETANPMKLNYQLYENNTMIGVISSTGVWNKTSWTVGGVFFYKCVVNNSVGTAMSLNVSVNVNVSSFITPISNEVITEGGTLNLSCPATGIPRPTVFWVKTSNGERTDGTELVIRNISRSEAGEYRCEATNPCGNASESATIDVQYPPEGIQLHVSEVEVCNGTTISFSCSAVTANPMKLNYQLHENNTMIGVISSTGVWNKTSWTVGGVFFYKCVVNNSVGTAMSLNVSVNVNVSSFIMPISNEVITEGGTLNLSCPATGIPPPTVFWMKTSNGERTDGTELVIRNISRSEAGEYRCEATNPCGNASESATIDVQYNPDTVRLVANATENRNCSDSLLVKFTCDASEANPPVKNYQLLKSERPVETSSNWKWIRNILSKGDHNYSCRALHSLGNVESTNHVTVTFNVPVQVSVHVKSGNETLTEGGNVSVYCGASAGYPEPRFSWLNLNTSELIPGQWLTFINISKEKSGDYICNASNTCGEKQSSVTTIDVQYKPENVHLSTSSRKICAGKMVILTCSTGDSNPAAENFTLYENGLRLANVTRAKVGVFNQMLYAEGQHSYSCVASNAIGNSSSNNTIVEVEVPASVTVENRRIVVKEGDNVTLHCMSSGFPYPNVTWVNNSNYIMEAGSILNLTNIRRHNREYMYNCSASNACGNDSRPVYIDVQYAAEATGRGGNYSVREGSTELFSCPVDGNPEPTITWYKDNELIEPAIPNAKQLEAGETGCYTCSAINMLGPPVTITQCLIVEPEEPTPTGQQTNQVYAELTMREEYVSEYRDLDNQVSKQLVYSFQSEMDKVYQNNSNYIRTEVTGLRNGSVIVSFTLYFKNSVTPNEGLKELQAAISNGTLGTYQVGNLTLLPSGVSTFTSTTPRTAEPTDRPTWIIIVAVTAGVVLLALVVTFVTWWVHKKRKCIKDTKIHNSECEESLHGDSPHAKVNRAYAESGPPSASGTQGAARQQSQDLGAIPTYAVVDKSKKKKKKEEKPPIYASVDKSKKRKKKTDDKNLYDNVEEPKKEKKPGEVLYAELGDFQNPAMPQVSTSPETLPPLKRAPSYEKTQYADITAFLKGDATLPQKEGNEGSEMQQQSVNQSQHDVDNKETPIQEDSPCSRVNGAYAKSGPPSANSTDVSSAAQKQPAQEAGAIPTYAVVDKSKKKKKEPEEMPLVNTDKGKSKKKKKKTYDKNLYDRVEEPKKEKKPGEIFYADLGEFQKQEMPKVATSPPTLPPLKRAPSYEKTDYADITQFLRKEATLPKVATSPPTLPPIKRAPSYEKTGYAEKEATLPPEKTPNSEMKPQAANQTHDEVENKETAL
ncbi:hemicentin-1-like isoform X1 [Montipora foliosa]|uniref:hemicentin-1-like isoform X1 n=1 Tax=Montipora foliosa TaxID=591990 RepID=UPI0035F1144F